jgi:putative ABC transport system permease protein
MSRIPGIRRLFRLDRGEQDVNRAVREELEFHFDMTVRELVSSGMSETAARDEAERRFGDLRAARERLAVIDGHAAGKARRADRWDALRFDIRYALRGVLRSPGLTAAVVVTLGLGIGAATAIYSVVDGVLLRPLPYPSSASLLSVTDVQRDQRDLPASYPEYLDWRQNTSSVFAEIGAMLGHGEVMSGNGDAEQLQGAMTSVNVLSMLGVTPILGRAFRPDEEGPAAPRVVMLSERLWRDRFARDPSIVGRTVILTGQSYTIIGVFASNLRSVLPAAGSFGQRKPVDFWEALNLTTSTSPRGLHYLNVVARLKPGVSFTAADSRIDEVAAVLRKGGTTTHGIHVTPLTTALVGDQRAPLAMLLAAVALLLAIGCANIANLLLGRAASRRREFAVRAALGAGRARVARHVVLEGMLRAVLGGTAGVGVAYVVIALAHRWLTDVPRLTEVSIDIRVLAVAFALSVATGLLSSIIPAIRAAKSDLVSDLREGARGSSGRGGRDRLRQGLIVGEIAMSFVVVVIGALLIRSFENLLAVPKGFDPSQLVAARTWLPTSRYPDSLSQIAFQDRLQTEMASSFGRSNVTVASALPVDGGTSGDVTIDGRRFAPGEDPMVEKRIVGNAYFDVVRARLETGRFFRAGDVLWSPPVAVVNQAFVKRWFPGESPLGKRIGFGWQTSAQQTIVGVIVDVREGALDAASSPAVYVSAEQVPNTFMNLVVRTDRASSAVSAAYRNALWTIDPALPVVDVRRVSDVVASSLRQRRLTTAILGAFALASLVLAGVGLYGVISYSVAQRTREFGVRAALGARYGDLMWLVLRQMTTWMLAGIGLGALASLATGKLISTQLFGVTRTDPWAFAAATMLLTAVAVVASAVPTLRAARSDPLEALQAD